MSHRLTRADLVHFDKEAKILILWAQDQGATVKISRRGHALIYGPKGRTAAVSQKSKHNNRSVKNTKASVERLFDDDRNPEEK